MLSDHRDGFEATAKASPPQPGRQLSKITTTDVPSKRERERKKKKKNQGKSPQFGQTACRIAVELSLAPRGYASKGWLRPHLPSLSIYLSLSLFFSHSLYPFSLSLYPFAIWANGAGMGVCVCVFPPGRFCRPNRLPPSFPSCNVQHNSQGEAAH